MYYIGIDGGGTKTIFGLFHEDKMIDSVELSTCHFAQVGYDGCAKVLKKGIDQLLLTNQLTNSQVIIGAGIGGYGNDKKIRQNIEMAMDKYMPNYKIYLTNDIHIAVLGTLNGEDGITIIAGTGSIAMAKVGNKIERIGGWGYQLGDEGSAYWVGKQMLSFFTKQADGRMDKTPIYQTVKEFFHLEDDYDIIGMINNHKNPRTKIAELSKICDDLANKGDFVCKDIFDKAAYEISLFVEGLKKYYDTKPNVSYYGSVCKSRTFLQSLEKHLHNVHFTAPKKDALYGAYLYAKEVINS